MTTAAWNNEPGMVKLLLEAGADPNGTPIRSPLGAAAFRGTVRSVEILLAHPKIEVDKLNIDRYTPLLTAASRGHAKIVEMLLKAGADSTLKDKRGKTAANHARGGVDNFQGIIQRLGRNTVQDGTDQPATATESKSEGKEKPQPKSKGRSQ